MLIPAVDVDTPDGVNFQALKTGRLPYGTRPLICIFIGILEIKLDEESVRLAEDIESCPPTPIVVFEFR